MTPVAIVAGVLLASASSPLAAIPDDVAAVHPQLVAERTAIHAAIHDFNGRVRAHDLTCDSVDIDDSTLKQTCSANKTLLNDEQRTLFDRIETFNDEVAYAENERNASCSAIETHLATTERQLAAISRHSARWQKDAQTWLGLGEQARDAALISAASSTLDLVLSEAHVQLDNSIALKEDQVQRFSDWYQAYKQELPEAERVAIEGRIQEMQTYRDVLQIIEYLKGYGDRIYAVAGAAQSGQTDQIFAQSTAGFLNEALTLMNASPEATLSVTAIQIASDAANGWFTRLVVERRVEELAGLDARQLDAVRSLTALYAVDVQQRLQLVSDARCSHDL